MSSIDLHSRPFDPGTIAKLEIFEDYAQAWIPTFVMSKVPEIHIFDFFSGPGYDKNGIKGSPIRILDKIYDFIELIQQKGVKVVVHFNEFEPNKKAQLKYQKLSENIDVYLENHRQLMRHVKVQKYNKDASALIGDLSHLISKYPSLVFLDQNGIKFISQKFLSFLENIEKCDCLFFVSSSYFKRLGKTNEFRRVLDFSDEELNEMKFSHVHRSVVEKVKLQLSKTKGLKLFPFSIRKGSNIFGIIFTSKSYAAVDKFLKIGWNRNKINGEADFDIDEDLSKAQLNLFSPPKLTKIESFKQELRELIRDRKIRNNEEALKYTYRTGNLYRHANEAVKAMKKENLIDYEGGTPGINYKYVFKRKSKRIIEYKIN